MAKKQSRTELWPGHELDPGMLRPENVVERRWGYPFWMCRAVVEDTARRVAKSKEQFPWPIFRGDCHAHTQHSDGVGTVAEVAMMVKAAGLDFQFVTDHYGVTQAAECRKYGLWFGQEPWTEHHHMGILGLDFAFAPKNKLFEDVADARRLGATVFIPHPAGWWPDVVYKPEALAALEKLPDPLLMEIVNGANNIFTAFDYTDELAVKLWDHLLMMGKTIHALGNTDAHAPHGIGMVWNAVFAPKCSQDAVLAALRAGRSFVSEGPLVHLSLGKAQMGQAAKASGRSKPLRVTAVDSRGLGSARVIADETEIAYWDARGATKLEQSVAIPKTVKRYVRFEAIARDGRRAFTNPIYCDSP